MAKMTETQKLRLKQKAKGAAKTGIAAVRTAGKVAVKAGRNVVKAAMPSATQRLRMQQTAKGALRTGVAAVRTAGKVSGKQLAALRRNLEKARAARRSSSASSTPATTRRVGRRSGAVPIPAVAASIRQRGRNAPRR